MMATNDWTSTAGLVVAGLALGFTIFSSWWLHFRRGRVIAVKPRGIEAAGSEEGQLVIGVPLVLANSGPATRVVRNLRLRILGKSDPRPLFWARTRHELKNPEPSEFPRPFPIPGRDAIYKLFQFQRDPGRLHFEEGRYEFQIEGRLDDSDDWAPLTAFGFTVESKHLPRINGALVTMDLEVEWGDTAADRMPSLARPR